MRVRQCLTGGAGLSVVFLLVWGGCEGDGAGRSLAVGVAAPREWGAVGVFAVDEGQGVGGWSTIL